MNNNKSNILLVFFLFIITDNIYTYLFAEFLEFISNDKLIFNGNSDSINNNFLLIVILVPFFETLIFQYIIIWIFYNVTENFRIPIIVSTLFFAIYHFFNIYYFIAILGSGFILSMLFITIYKRTNNWLISFIFTFLLHLEHNLVAFYIE
jgi:hypothetical protein